MAQRALKLGTRRSALARAQSAAVARLLEQQHPGLTVQLVGIDTRGDRIPDQPLSSVEGKEFFTAEIDAALLRGAVDFTVHSFKDLSLERSSRLLLAAVPRRAPPHDVVVFAPDVPQRLVAGEELLIGSSSPRRASFVPDLLQQVLPHHPGQAHARLVELRGNVDSRLRRLREPRGAARQLDGVVLAFAGLARLCADESAGELLAPLLRGLPRMVLPLSECPPAPAQGALALECRRDDIPTAALLACLDDVPARRAVQAERMLLEARGGGCQQRFGAVRIELPGLGALLYSREVEEGAGAPVLRPTQLQWTPSAPLPPLVPPVRAWDGSRAAPPAVTPWPEGLARARERLPQARAVFVAHRRALPPEALPPEALASEAQLQIPASAHLWVPGVDTWRALAQRGLWVEGCAEGLGFASLAALLAEPWLELPAPADWLVLTHAQALTGWPAGSAVATYAHAEAGAGDAGPPGDATHVYWASSAQFDRWSTRLGADTLHACGPGKTYEHIRRAGVHNLWQFPQAGKWREWVRG